MRIPKRLTITASTTVIAVLAVGGIAMATPTSPEVPGTANAMMAGQVDHMPAGARPWTDWMGDMHGADVDRMDEMHADGWTDGDMDALHGRMGAMHGDAEQMAQYHHRLVECDPELQQRHDDTVDRYPERRAHMGAVEPFRGPER